MPPESIKKRIYFIRHGQSKGNIEKVFQNAEDPLSEVGKIQAKHVAHKAKSFDADILLSSPMVRAYQTALAIQQVTELPLETHGALKEYSAPSKLWNKPLDSPESKAFYEEMRQHTEDREWHYADEENYFDLYDRASALLDHLATREEKTIIAVTHGAFMRFVLATMMTEGDADPLTAIRLFRFLSQKNTGITSCEYRDDVREGNRWRLVAWNDYSHLAKVTRDTIQA